MIVFEKIKEVQKIKGIMWSTDWHHFQRPWVTLSQSSPTPPRVTAP